jgi:hypothetical protein
MKIFILFLTTFLLQTSYSIGQQNPPLRKLTYKISITDSGMRELEGYLFNATDTSLKVSHWPVKFGFDAALKDNFKEVPYHQISEIKLKRSHSAGRGALIGTVTGLVIGAAAGLIEGDDPPEYWFRVTAGEKALIYGALGAGGGAVIGTIIGAIAKKKFIIGGNKEKFDAMKQNVMNKAYGPQNKNMK